MAENILSLENADCYYSDGTHALKDVTVKLPKGKKIAVLGANGAGKSSLFLSLIGILPLKKGNLFFNGKKINKKETRHLRAKVGIVFQDPDSQIFSADIRQEIAFGPLNLGLSNEEVLESVQKAMHATEIENLAEKATHSLSYGQKKRVAIADILAMNPEVLILDEPLAWLDPKHARDTEGLLNNLAKQGKTIMVSTHDVNMAYAFAEHCIVMKNGKILAEGTPEEIFLNKELLITAELEVPWVLKVFTEGGLKAKILPKTVEELIATVNEVTAHAGA